MEYNPYTPGELSREDCPNECQEPADAAGLAIASKEILEAAGKLACLIIEKKEFQNFLRLGRVIRTDRKVSDLLGSIEKWGYDSDYRTESVKELEQQLEDLPVMREYRRAEQAARALFRDIDQAISMAAGLDFAVYAHSKACG